MTAQNGDNKIRTYVHIVHRDNATYNTRAMLKHSKASERMFCGVANH